MVTRQVVKVRWDKMKEFIDQGNKFSYIDEGGSYRIDSFNDFIEVVCWIFDKNSDEKTDFETNYMAQATNEAVPKDTDGAQVIRSKTTVEGWHYAPRVLSFHTSTLKSLVNDRHYGTDTQSQDIGDAFVSFYDASDTELVQGGGESDEDFQTRLDANCVKTILFFQPQYDKELIGSFFSIDKDVEAGKYAYAWLVAAPDVPENLGGNVAFLSGGMSLAFIKEKILNHFDGRGTKYLPYDPVYLSDKQAVILKHSVGYKIGMQVIFEMYEA